MKEALARYYRSIAPELLAAMPAGQRISSPLFLSVMPEYECARKRLLIVGQETHSWYGLVDDLRGVADPVEWMESRYREFDLGQSYRKSLFCETTRRIQEQLAPDVPISGFMWSNLFPCDEKGKTPSPEIADKLRRFRILPHEIEILRPHAIIFLTGPNYDYVINDFFRDCAFAEIIPEISKRGLAQLAHVELPKLTFRTFHPNSLRRQQKSHYVDLILDEIKKEWTREPSV